MGRFGEHFGTLADPRARNKRHDLAEVLFVALAACVGGADNCVEMAQFGLAKEGLLRRFLELDHGIPSHATFSRLFRLLDPEAFEAAFQGFMRDFAGALAEGEVVALDGKTLRRSFDTASARSPLHLVSAWASGARLVLGQRAVAPGDNENQALLDLLGMLDLRGCVVTADAMHCQRRAAEAVIGRSANYVLSLKEDQPSLLDDVRLLLDGPHPPPHDTHEAVDGGHGRIETRRCAVLSDVGYLQSEHAFPGLAAVAKITATREVKGRTATATRYFVLSQTMPARRVLDVVRAHWGIENSLHWVLDVTMDEDQVRSRRDHGAENLALLRRFAVNLLGSSPGGASTRVKRKRAGWDDDALLAALTQVR